MILCLLLPFLGKGQQPATLFLATKKIMAETSAITSLPGISDKDIPSYTFCALGKDSWVHFYQVMSDSSVQQKNVRLCDLSPLDIAAVEESSSTPERRYFSFTIGKDVALYGNDREAVALPRKAFYDIVMLAVN